MNSHFLYPFLLLACAVNGVGFGQSSGTLTDDRDGNTYQTVSLNGLSWMTENLRFQSPYSISVGDSIGGEYGICGAFYSAQEFRTICPKNWRLPTEAEVKSLVKGERKKRYTIADTLNITKCGRIDGLKISKVGLQNTFWIDAPMVNGHIMHWHLFHDGQELHNHNVVVSKRQFPVRCVCELGGEN